MLLVTKWIGFVGKNKYNEIGWFGTVGKNYIYKSQLAYKYNVTCLHTVLMIVIILNHSTTISAKISSCHVIWFLFINFWVGQARGTTFQIDNLEDNSGCEKPLTLAEYHLEYSLHCFVNKVTLPLSISIWRELCSLLSLPWFIGLVFRYFLGFIAIREMDKCYKLIHYNTEKKLIFYIIIYFRTAWS